MFETSVKAERALLVGAFLKQSRERETCEQYMQEIRGLAETAGLEVVGSIQSFVEAPNSGTFVGSGKVEEISQLCESLDVDVVVFQRDLTAVQERNLERALDRKVINRTELILDIFALHAHSQGGKLQVELAQLRYRLTHLTGRGVLMSRLGGGIGTRGPGETKLETDRRSIQNLILRLTDELKNLEKYRKEQRKSRIRTAIPVVSIVGYTNAGKSSLLNALTHASVTTENQLFTTLDTTTRKFTLPNGRATLLSDTVGFIRNMPKDLKTAFRATLEEIQTSAFILHVVDVSCSDREDKMAAVRSILEELKVLDRPILTVFNKADLLQPDLNMEGLLHRFEPACLVSSHTGAGLDTLGAEIGRLSESGMRQMTLMLPLNSGKILALIHEEGKILTETFEQDRIVVDCEIPHQLFSIVEPYLVGDSHDQER